jgi:beta-lactamase class A
MLLTITYIEAIFEQCKHWLPYFFVAIFVVEAIVLITKLQSYFNKETTVNLVTGALTISIQTILKTVFLYNIYPIVYGYRIYTVDSFWWGLLFAFLLYTFIQFATHYIYHKVRIFWCLHEVHHSAINMNITTGLRTSIFDIVSLEMFYLLIPFLGMDPMFYFLLYILNKFWGTFIHISEHLLQHHTLFNKLIVTPTVHHIHHASNGDYKDKNFGEIIPWFDIVFGTFSTYNKPLVYGTTKVQQHIGFWEAQTHEFKSLFEDMRNTKSIKNKIKYLFMPPSWQPAITEKTTSKKWAILLVLFLATSYFGEAQKINKKLQTKVENLIKGFNGDIGVYVKSLKSDKIISINADNIFPTASMVKVPILIGLMDKINKGELTYHQEFTYKDSLLYAGEDILGSFKNNEIIHLSKVIMLMLTTSDNTASLWLQSIAGTGTTINELMAANGLLHTRVNSRTPGRENNRTQYGWGQTTPKEMVTIFEKLYKGDIINDSMSKKMIRLLGRNYWDEEALSVLPATTFVASKNGAVDASRSETILVMAKEPFVLSIITKNNKDKSWEHNNEAWVLTRKLTALLFQYYNK